MSLVNCPLRIVLVEPSVGDARWLEIVLSEANITYEITPYDTGVAALEELSTEPPSSVVDFVGVNCVLAMLSLKDFIGRLRAIRGFESTPSVVFVVEEYEVSEALNLGAVACLLKPVDVAQLNSVIPTVRAANLRFRAMAAHG